MAETKKDAVTALEAFVETYQVKSLLSGQTQGGILERGGNRGFGQ
jgi:hypothetical protein